MSPAALERQALLLAVSRFTDAEIIHSIIPERMKSASKQGVKQESKHAKFLAAGVAEKFLNHDFFGKARPMCIVQHMLC